jgi:nitrite reductase/ring-hydroxylating ferredoxin subunit
MQRFDDTSFGHGWFQAGYSEDLRKGDVRPVSAVGKEFVLWRDAEGKAHANDAHCPHLGTHLGHGGHVCGTTLKCPFHGWQFDGNGACTDIPYSPNPRLELRHLKSWPLVERNGLLMVWWRPQGIAPTFEIPVLREHGDAQWSRYRRQSWEVATIWQEVQENIVDTTHFHHLHGVATLARLDRFEPAGPALHVNILHEFNTPRGRLPGYLQTSLYGAYFATVRFRIADLAEVLFIDSVVPIEAGRVEVTFSLMARLQGIGAPDMSLALVDEAIHQVSQDVPIWEHKMRWKRPSLAEGDGPIMRFRQWAEQFTAATTETKAMPVHRMDLVANA